MEIKITPDQIKFLRPDELQPNPKNRNKHSAEQIDRLVDIIKYQGFRQPIIVSNRSGLVVAGHGRLEAAKQLALAKVPVAFQDFDSEEQEWAFGVSDNAIASWAELDLSGINVDVPAFGPDFNLDLLGIKDFELGIPGSGGEGEGSEDIYTKKITAPTYEPKGEKPPVIELFSVEKTAALIEEIDRAEGIDEQTKAFLKLAAQRHTVFDYAKIAEFYCHQPARVQDLMEKSALVIIDFNKAVENGFIQMTKDISGAYDGDEN